MENMLSKMKNNKNIVMLAVFCAIVLLAIIIGSVVLKAGVVAVCILVILQAAIAALMHQAELWAHGLVVLVELIAGIITSNIMLTLMCILVYVAATYLLESVSAGENR